MSERLVEIPVSKELRNKIKKLKGKYTYEMYLGNLIKKKSARENGLMANHQDESAGGLCSV